MPQQRSDGVQIVFRVRRPPERAARRRKQPAGRWIGVRQSIVVLAWVPWKDLGGGGKLKWPNFKFKFQIFSSLIRIQKSNGRRGWRLLEPCRRSPGCMAVTTFFVTGSRGGGPLCRPGAMSVQCLRVRHAFTGHFHGSEFACWSGGRVCRHVACPWNLRRSLAVRFADGIAAWSMPAASFFCTAALGGSHGAAFSGRGWPACLHHGPQHGGGLLLLALASSEDALVNGPHDAAPWCRIGVFSICWVRKEKKTPMYSGRHSHHADIFLHVF